MKLGLNLPLLGEEKAIGLASATLTASSILLSFFLFLVTNRRRDIGLTLAFLMWVAIMVLLSSSLLGIVAYMGIDGVLRVVLVGNTFISLSLLIVFIGLPALYLAYKGEGGGNGRGNARNRANGVGNGNRGNRRNNHNGNRRRNRN